MQKGNNFYRDKVVYKPWGYEYVVYSNSNRLAITFLKINYGHKTSLHSHPKKKTGFIILNGKALVQIGLYKENNKCYRPLSRLVFRPGLFHSIKAVSKQGVCALEFETPFKKNGLARTGEAHFAKVKFVGKYIAEIQSGSFRPGPGSGHDFSPENLKFPGYFTNYKFSNFGTNIS